MDSNQTYEINETEKARILAEEKYREEIRADLAKLRTPSTRRQRLWNFLNTSLGIWLLSSIVLGGFGFLYTTSQSLMTERRSKATSVRKLDTEIASRFLQWYRIGEVEEIKRDFAEPSAFARFYGWLIKPPNQAANFLYVIYPVFPEYEQRPLISLVTELRTLVDGSQELELDKVVDRLVTWDPIIDPQGSFSAYREKVLELFMLPRWKKKVST